MGREEATWTHSLTGRLFSTCQVDEFTDEFIDGSVIVECLDQQVIQLPDCGDTAAVPTIWYLDLAYYPWSLVKLARLSPGIMSLPTLSRPPAPRALPGSPPTSPRPTVQGPGGNVRISFVISRSGGSLPPNVCLSVVCRLSVVVVVFNP